MMINHRRNAAQELSCVTSVVFWQPQCDVSVSGGLLAVWDAPRCFSALYKIGLHQTFGDMHLNTRKRKKEERGHMC